MDVERSLVSQVILTGDMTPLHDARITRQHFRDTASQAVYDSITRHVTEHGQVPTLAIARTDHPDYRFLKAVDETSSYLIQELRRARSLSIFEQGLTNAVLAFERGSVKRMRDALSGALSQEAAEVPHGRDLDLTTGTEDFWAYYEQLKALDGRLRGLPTGFPSLDSATQGWQGGNFIVFYGVAKSGKSTLLLNSAMACHRHGRRPMFVGYEMSNREQEERHHAFFAGINFERLRAGRLNVPEEKKLRRALNQLQSMEPFHLSTDAMGTATVDALVSKATQLQPSAIYLDGVYMMDDNLGGEPRMSPQALSNICQALKAAAMTLDIPIICTTQALESKLGKGGRLTSASVGYSSAFAQYCDVLVGVEQTEEPQIQRVSQILGRNSKPFETYLEWNWDTGSFVELDANPYEPSNQATYALAAGF